MEKILQARENRWNYRCHLVEKYSCPVISLTLNIPGPDKRKDLYRKAHKVIFEDYLHFLNRQQIEIIDYKTAVRDDGPEAFIVIKGNGVKVKKLSIQFEESHSLGRLADIDVLNINKKALSRRDFQGKERKCLLCSEPARNCIISKRHQLKDVLEKAEEMINNYIY